MLQSERCRFVCRLYILWVLCHHKNSSVHSHHLPLFSSPLWMKSRSSVWIRSQLREFLQTNVQSMWRRYTTLIVRKNIFYIYSFALPAFVLTNCTGDEPKQKNEIIIAGLNRPSRLHRETNEKEFSSSVLGLWLLQTAKMWDKNLNNIYLCVYVGVLWGVSSWCTPSCTRWSDTCAPASSHQRMPPSWSALASPYLRLSLFSQASAAQCLFRSTPGLQSCLFPPRVRTVVCWWWLTPARLHLHPGCQSKSWKWSQGSGRVLLSCQRSRCWRRS